MEKKYWQKKKKNYLKMYLIKKLAIRKIFLN